MINEGRGPGSLDGSGLRCLGEGSREARVSGGEDKVRSRGVLSVALPVASGVRDAHDGLERGGLLGSASGCVVSPAELGDSEGLAGKSHDGAGSDRNGEGFSGVATEGVDDGGTHLAVDRGRGVALLAAWFLAWAAWEARDGELGGHVDGGGATGEDLGDLDLGATADGSAVDDAGDDAGVGDDGVDLENLGDGEISFADCGEEEENRGKSTAYLHLDDSWDE